MNLELVVHGVTVSKDQERIINLRTFVLCPNWNYLDGDDVGPQTEKHRVADTNYSLICGCGV